METPIFNVDSADAVNRAFNHYWLHSNQPDSVKYKTEYESVVKRYQDNYLRETSGSGDVDKAEENQIEDISTPGERSSQDGEMRGDFIFFNDSQRVDEELVVDRQTESITAPTDAHESASSLIADLFLPMVAIGAMRLFISRTLGADSDESARIAKKVLTVGGLTILGLCVCKSFFSISTFGALLFTLGSFVLPVCCMRRNGGVASFLADYIGGVLFGTIGVLVSKALPSSSMPITIFALFAIAALFITKRTTKLDAQ